MADGAANLFEDIIRSIQTHPNRTDAVRMEAERRLEEAIEDGLKYSLPVWKKRGDISTIAVVFTLPASNAVTETTLDYEREVYGRAARILEREGFVFVERDQRWYYQR